MWTGTLICLRLQSFTNSLNSHLAVSWCHLESQSGTRFETPTMCLALITNWCLAANSATSLRMFCRSGSLLLPVLITEATASLSTWIQKYMPWSVWAHNFKATMTARISKCAMFPPLSSGGNFPLKYSWPFVPPYPTKHASVAIIVSG